MFVFTACAVVLPIIAVLAISQGQFPLWSGATFSLCAAELISIMVIVKTLVQHHSK